jgi:hypothetical protein
MLGQWEELQDLSKKPRSGKNQIYSCRALAPNEPNIELFLPVTHLCTWAETYNFQFSKKLVHQIHRGALKGSKDGTALKLGTYSQSLTTFS